VQRGRADDRLERGDAMQYFVSRDRIRAIAIDRCRKPFELGGERVETLILDDFRRGRCIAASRGRFRRRREAEFDILVRELDATFCPVAQIGR